MGESTVMYYVELHAHTFPASSDSEFTPESIVMCAKDVGLDGLVISNHYDWYQLHRWYGTFQDQVNAWLQDVVETKKYGEQYGVKVFCGLEYTIDSQLHFGVLGVTEELLKDDPPEPDGSVQYLTAYVREHKLYLIENHPFRKGYRFCPLLGVGYEMYNTKKKYNDVTRLQAEQTLSATKTTNCLYVAGTDAHQPCDLGRSAMVFHKAVLSERDLMNKVMNREYSIALNLEGGELRKVSLLTL